MKAKNPLGKGLQALIPNPPSTVDGGRVVFCGIEELRPGTYQARKSFTPNSLQELVNSIIVSGVIQPLLVRRVVGQPGYEIVAGERRWRAAQRAGLQDVPVIVKSFSDVAAAEASLLENLQREDLNPIEEAEAFERLIGEFGNTHEALAQRLGKDRSTITNALRLLKLPEFARVAVVEGRISSGHARCLIGLPDGTIRDAIAIIISKGLSVRATEALLSPKTRKAEDANTKKAYTADDLSRSLSSSMRCRVQVMPVGSSGKGKIVIAYSSPDELNGIIRILRQDTKGPGF